MNDSSLGRLVGAIVEPTATFRSIRERPTWLVAMMTLILVSLAASAVVVPSIDWQELVESRIERSGQSLTPEQVDQQVEVTKSIGPVMGYVFPVVLGPIVFLVVALVLWVMFNVLGGEIRYVQSLSATVYAFAPAIISGLLTIPVVLLRGNVTSEQVDSGRYLASHLGVLVSGAEHPVLKALASSFDLFGLWTVALLIIGFGVVAGVSRARAAVGVLIPWLLAVLFRVGMAMLPALMRG